LWRAGTRAGAGARRHGAVCPAAAAQDGVCAREIYPAPTPAPTNVPLTCSVFPRPVALRVRDAAHPERRCAMVRWRRVATTLLLLAPPVVGGGEVSAQAARRGDRVSVRTGTALRATPGGDVIGVSSRTITGDVEVVQGTFVRLTIDGHLPAADLQFTADRSRGEVARAAGTRLRAGADARSDLVAELRRGTFVFPARAGARFPAARTGTVAVRRSLWVDVSRVSRGEAAAGPPRASTGGAAGTAGAEARGVATARAASPAGPGARDTSAVRDSGRQDSARRDSVRRDSTARAVATGVPTLETRGPASLRSGPRGDVVATILGGIGLTPLAREQGWVRVRIEGWLPDSSLEAAGARAAGALTAADLRANPGGTAGRLVRWTVEVLALQEADALRRGLAPGERYLLARGPGDERAVLYLVVPDALLAQARALAPLTAVAITARVRNGRSEPSGVPVLELLELGRR
jgi:hypothetical protein